jgi:hypothetical protein
MNDEAAGQGAQEKKWQPLNSRQRRVLGVLIEKAKTTPDAYPMTLNAIVVGCNQKSNREPVMELSADDVELVLEELRALGAVTEVQGQGRVAKYRHHAYEWLGIEGLESAVMTELLLRGEQTLGELRGRAARMGAIADLAGLKPIVESLLKKGLMIELTPPGRGQLVTHNIYKERELEELKRQFAGHVAAGDDTDAAASEVAGASPAGGRAAAVSPAMKHIPASPAAAPQVTRDMFSELELEVAQLRTEVVRLRERLRQMEQTVGVSPGEIEAPADS